MQLMPMKKKTMNIIQNNKLPSLIVILTIIVGYCTFVGIVDISGLTTILVLTTIYYACQTKEMVTEMKSARESQFHPYLKIIPIKRTDTFHSILGAKIVNIGIGPAHKIKGTMKLEPNGGEKKIDCPFLHPREEYYLPNEFEFKSSGNYESIKKFKEITFSVKFKDILGIEHKNNEDSDKFNLSDFSKIKDDDREHKDQFY